MTDRVNLADPDREPTDEQLAGLVTRAFAELRTSREPILRKLRADIAAAREEVLRTLEGSAAQHRDAK